jgi:hypothetical protein
MHNNALFSRKKQLPYARGGDFIGGLCIIFLIFFYLVMFHELHGTNMKPMVIEKS